MSSPLDTVLSRLSGAKRNGDGFMARCPAHEDHTQSLSIKEGEDGRVLLHCFTGCTTEDILAKIGLGIGDLFPPKEHSGNGSRVIATYEYTDESGAVLFEKLRFEPKDFRARRKVNGAWVWKLDDTRRVLYRLPAVVKAAAAGELVFIVEGEKDVHTLERLGYTATCNYDGASKEGQKPKWRDEYGDCFVGARVALLPDNDEPGRLHMQAAAQSLAKRGIEHVTVELPGLPDKGDVSDFLVIGGTEELLLAYVEEAFEAGKPKPKSIDGETATRLCLEELGRRQRGEVKGLPWPPEWTMLADTMGPIEPGTFTVIASRPSVGKTIAGQQIQRHLCSAGYRVLYVSRELTPVRLVNRHVAHYGANLYHLRKGTLDHHDQDAFDRYREQAAKWAVFYDYTSRTVAEISTEAQLREVDCVIVDYLQRLSYETDNEYAGLTQIVNELQDVTLSTGIPIICLSQLSRPIKGKEHKAPTMSDTRGSGAVEERATSLLLLHRRWETEKDDYGHEVGRQQSPEGWFIVAKNADGHAGLDIRFKVDGRRFRILEQTARAVA